MRLHWSDIVEADLDDIYNYIARDVPYYAELFIERLIEATDKLEEHPRSGRRVPEVGNHDHIRELIVQGYRIIYRVGAGEIQILTVIHGSRDLAGQEGKVRV
jgi:addiction module RelE/StbE family toxin